MNGKEYQELAMRMYDGYAMNVDKLKVRYPEGFDVDKANNRENGDV